MPTPTSTRFQFWTEQQDEQGRSWAHLHTFPTLAYAITAHRHARAFLWAPGARAYLSELWDGTKVAAGAHWQKP